MSTPSSDEVERPTHDAIIKDAPSPQATILRLEYKTVFIGISHEFNYAGMAVALTLSEAHLLTEWPSDLSRMICASATVHATVELKSESGWRHVYMKENIPLRLTHAKSLEHTADTLKSLLDQIDQRANRIGEVMAEVLRSYKFMLLRYTRSEKECDLSIGRYGYNLQGSREHFPLPALAKRLMIDAVHNGIDMPDRRLMLISNINQYISDHISHADSSGSIDISLADGGGVFMQLLTWLTRNRSLVNDGALRELMTDSGVAIGIDTLSIQDISALGEAMPIILATLSRKELEELDRKASLIRIGIISKTL